jgi:SAM-dependent methyltransferase
MEPRIGNYEGIKELKLMELARNYNEWLLELCRPYIGLNLLEIGAGIGTFTKEWANITDQVTAIEIADNCAAILKDRFQNNNKVKVMNDDFLNLRPSIFGEVDTVVSFNVFEHIENDLKGFQLVYDSLVKGGVFLIYVPAFQSLYGKTDQEIGHYRRYNKASLTKKLEQVGFAIEKKKYVNLVGYFAWYLKAKRSNVLLSKRDIQIYDRLVIPWLKVIERYITPPFGQSVFVVAKKK